MYICTRPPHHAQEGHVAGPHHRGAAWCRYNVDKRAEAAFHRRRREGEARKCLNTEVFHQSGAIIATTTSNSINVNPLVCFKALEP